MKLTTLSLLALSASTINARFVETHETNQVAVSGYDEAPTYLIELSPGETRLVTEEQKWELKRVRFFITHADSESLTTPSKA